MWLIWWYNKRAKLVLFCFLLLVEKCKQNTFMIIRPLANNSTQYLKLYVKFLLLVLFIGMSLVIIFFCMLWIFLIELIQNEQHLGIQVIWTPPNNSCILQLPTKIFIHYYGRLFQCNHMHISIPSKIFITCKKKLLPATYQWIKPISKILGTVWGTGYTFRYCVQLFAKGLLVYCILL